MNDSRGALTPREDPGRATAVNGLVILDGPDGIAVTMTAEAAAATAASLHEAAIEARRNPQSEHAGSDDPPDEVGSEEAP